MNSKKLSMTVLYCCIGSKNLKTIWEKVNDTMGENVSKGAVIEEVNKLYSIKSKHHTSSTL